MRDPRGWRMGGRPTMLTWCRESFTDLITFRTDSEERVNKNIFY